jgi:hypothetical protein
MNIHTNYTFLDEMPLLHTYIHTHTHTHIYIYIYIYVGPTLTSITVYTTSEFRTYAVFMSQIAENYEHRWYESR